MDYDTSDRKKLLGWLIDRVKVIDGCWEWQGKTTRGYAYTRNPFNMKNTRVHRLTYETFRQEIPEGLVIDHLCRNRKCLNPDHLEAVTLVENVMRGESQHAKNARKTHCKHGHEFTTENIYSWRGKRMCRECRTINKRSVYAGAY